MGVVFERIVKEDLNMGVGQTIVSMPGGGSALGTKIGLHTFTGWFNPDDRGAVGDGVTDDTAAIQATINAALAWGDGGVVFFPPKPYAVTSLSLCNTVTAEPSASIRMVGSGRLATRLIGIQSGTIILDAIGRSFASLENLTIATATGVACQAAVLLARRTGGAIECRNNQLHHLRIEGNYTVGSVVSLAAEITVFDEVEFCNDDATNGYCCFFTGLGNSVAGITSAHGTPLESTNTFNLMRHCTFYAPHANATPVIFHQGAGYIMDACSVQVGNFTGVHCVTYIDSGEGPGGGFLGPVEWRGALWECAQATVHYLDTRTTTGYYQNITDVAGSYTLYGASAANMVMATNGTTAVLHKCRVEDVRYYGGASSSLGLTVDYANACHFDIWSPAFATAITVGSARSSSYFRAQTLNLPATETDFPTYPASVSAEDADVMIRTLGVGTTPTSAQTAAIGGGRSAVSGFAWGQVLTPTLTATANGDRLTALEIYPTFVPGAFTGVTKYAYFNEVADAGFWQAGPATFTEQVNVRGATTSAIAQQVYALGDANPRCAWYANGGFAFGDGTNAPDVVLYRGGVNRLATDDQLETGLDFKCLAAGRGVILTNAAGTVTKRVRLNDAGDGLLFETP